MGLAQDLLAQAADLAAQDVRRPRQANLRRSISSAYYALFHHLVAESVSLHSPTTPRRLAPRIGRAFVHGEMKQVCRIVADGNLTQILREILPAGFSPDMQQLAAAFVRLQEARHAADYDTSISYSRSDALALIGEAGAALNSWRTVRGTDEANVFLSALLFNSKWSK